MPSSRAVPRPPATSEWMGWEQPPRLRGCRGLGPPALALHTQPCEAGAISQASRGAFAGDTPALLGQGLSKRSPLMCAMSTRKRKATDSMEQACMLCLRAEADADVCGPKLEKQGVCAHAFCLYFANELFQQRVKEVGLAGFLPEDIQRTIAWAAQKDCFVCGDSGATITCREMGCDRSFHLPCAVEGGCITQFFGLYRSFCWEHRPEQAVEAAPEETTTCLICLDPVGDRKSFGTMVCPACKHAWFHRGCIQVHASHAGFYGFCCPHCQNEYRFLMEMLTMGIRIPKRGLSWEDNGAYEQLYERHRRCDASECLCPAGRERAEEEGPWQLLLCCSCAAEGTHKRCSYLRNSTASWECDSCAGLGTGGLEAPHWPILPQVWWSRALDLPASPYSLQCQLGA
ncbi:E3 ubiquitin-protein ligase PHF7-like [Phalacrocorax aristotelis]|uniref:E3 ubiquitin-protein ligase PHF7-like n=1 Tax=Phalacrocorax aristotelis TaxID=126867 RepID=UPI003F4B1E65